MTYSDPSNDLLRLLWQTGFFCRSGQLPDADGLQYEVRQTGEYDPRSRTFFGCEVVRGNEILRGDVFFGDSSADAFNGRAVLQVVEQPGILLLRDDGSLVPQVVVPVDASLKRAVDTLRGGIRHYECGLLIGTLDSCHRSDLFTSLAMERLETKCRVVDELYGASAGNWSQTLYQMLFSTMGDDKQGNRQYYLELARRVPYNCVARERDSVQAVEAMLLGTAGLLPDEPAEEYLRELCRDYVYLQRKYSLKPLYAGGWNLKKIKPLNHPMLRIVQLASFLCTSDFIFDNLMRCRTEADVQALFRAEASGFWTTRYTLEENGRPCPKRIGVQKANLLGINLVVPLMMSYGRHTDQKALKEQAVDLLERLPVESNRYLTGWSGMGVVMRNAFDSQAMLQLTKCYCQQGRCTECRIGRSVIKKGIKALV